MSHAAEHHRSEQTAFEKALAESEERYRAVVQQVSEAIFLLDVDTMCLLEANPAFQNMLGYSPEEIPRLSLYDLLPYDRARVDRTTRRAMEQGTYSVSDRLYRRKDGSFVNVEVGITPISYGGRWVLCEVLRDITERKRTEEALRQSEQRFRVLAEAIPQLVWTTGPTGSPDYFNRRMIDYTGILLEQLPGFDWTVMIHPEDLPGTLEKWAEAQESGEPLTVEYRLRAADGSYRWFLGRGVALRNAQGEITKWFGTSTDIHDQKQLDQRKDDFIALASHELKTPITSLKIFAQVLKKRFEKHQDNDLAKDAARQLGRMDEQLNKLTELVQSLLDVSKIEAGKLDYSMDEIDLNELLRETVEDLQRLSARHTLTLRSHGEPWPPHVKVVADKERIRQVITNLITNAIKYSPQASSVIISSEISEAGEQVIVSVQDFGIGIPESEQDRIFERFFQVRNPGHSRAETYPGLGLGLFISSQIVRRHGGRIWVDSRVGSGSTFHFMLPTGVSG